MPLEASDSQRAGSPQGLSPVALPRVESDELDLGAMEKDIKRVLRETLAELGEEGEGSPALRTLTLTLTLTPPQPPPPGGTPDKSACFRGFPTLRQ